MPVSVAPPAAADWAAWGFEGPPAGPVTGVDPRLDWDDFTGDDPTELSVQDNLTEPSASVVRVVTTQTSPRPGTKPFPRFGINAAKLYFKESGGSSKYGALSVILDDIEQLGASFVRQTGLCDLVWPDDLEVPLAADMDRVVEVALRTPLEALFNELQNRSLQVVFTLFQIARLPFRDPSGGTATQPDDPLGEIGDSASPLLFSPSVHSDSSAVYVDPSGMSWTILDIEDRTGAKVTLDASTSSSETYRWAYGIFDPRSPYKRNLLRAFAASVARLLDLLSFDNPSWYVYDKVLAIELGNEVDRKNVCDFTGVASTRGPELWAALVAEMVAGLEDGWGRAGAKSSLWYPSIASWGGGVTFFPDPSSTDLSVRRFQSTLLAAIKSRLTTTQLGFFTNQDYHFYHTVSDGLHYGVPPEELARMAISLSSLPTVTTQATLSICETGTSIGYTDTARGVQGEPKEVADDYSYADLAASRGNTAVLDAFQAREVWRRLAMGAASGAAFLAWTTHISSESVVNEFAHFGLRDDDEPDDVATPSLAQPRLAWSAFQRLTSLLDWGTGSARVARASVIRSAAITPDSSTGGWVTPSSSVVADYLVILRFRGLRYGPYTYAYLLFVDPTCSNTSGTVSVEAVSGSDYDLAVLVATVPTPGAPAAAASTDEFPVATHSFAADVPVAINHYVVDLGVDSDPVLIFVGRPLEFRV